MDPSSKLFMNNLFSRTLIFRYPNPYPHSQTTGEFAILVTLLSDGGVDTEVVSEELGYTLMEAGDELGVSITLISSLQRFGEQCKVT